MKISNLVFKLCAFLFMVTISVVNGQHDSNSNKMESILDSEKADEIESVVNLFSDYGQFNGSILVAQNGEVVFKKGYGFANMEWDIENQTDTKFRIASMTKQFTAMLIMQLVAENLLNLETPISEYVEDFPKENGDIINIHHLLTHTSGLPNYTSFPVYQKLMPKTLSPEELVQIFADSTLEFSPGERFSYSNSGYAMLGLIMEKVSGKSFEKNLQERIFEPLKMKNSGYDSNKIILKNRAWGYNNTAGVFSPSKYIDMSVAFTAGGIYSTVEDLFLWDQALYTEKLLPKKYMDMIFAKHIPAWGKDYGYGWNVGKSRIGNTREEKEIIEHDGYVNGFNTIIKRYPADQSTIIILNNTGGAPLRRMARSITGVLYDVSYDLPKKSIANEFLKRIKKDGISDAVTFFEENKNSEKYKLDENEMNMSGYNLLQADRPEDAKEVFKLNVEAFPKSANTFDSYAEVLAILGDKSAAIDNYRKSLRRDPENKNAIEMLKKLGVQIQESDLYLLNSGDKWGKEMFTFPLRFAPDLKFTGFEEAHFPRGWRDTENNEFWSYIFSWDLDQINEPTAKELENYVQIYFDGLMKGVNKIKDFTVPKSMASLKQNNDVEGLSSFTGTVKVHDAFITEKELTLNTIIEVHSNAAYKNSIIIFRFSPSDFDNEIWTRLNNIKLWKK